MHKDEVKKIKTLKYFKNFFYLHPILKHVSNGFKFCKEASDK